ncbi:MAG: hypothetical protein KGY41_01030 [Desulfovermiculus sp.]|nr:hypothetical protein [Desulfovermiculus sp.]
MHIVAHPFYDMNNRLHIDHFEQMLLLFELLQFVDCALTGRTWNNKGFWNWLYDYLGTKRGGWSFFKPGGSSDVTSMIHQEGRAILNNNPVLLTVIKVCGHGGSYEITFKACRTIIGHDI